MTSPQLGLADLGMLPPTGYVFPVTYRYFVIAPWGFSQQELTLDLPGLAGRPQPTIDLGRDLWELAVARATSISTGLYGYEVMAWRSSLAPFLQLVSGVGGLRSGAAAARRDSPQLVLMTGDGNRRWRRRLFAAGAPASWQADGLLTRDGWEGMMELARTLYMGLSWIYPNPTSSWLIAYPGVVPSELSNPQGVGFRRVTGLRVCWHVDEAPEFTMM